MTDISFKDFKQRVAKHLKSVNSDITDDTLLFGNTLSGFSCGYRPAYPNSSIADFDVYMNINNNHITMYGNYSESGNTRLEYCDISDYELGIEYTDIRQAYKRLCETKAYTDMDIFLEMKTPFDLSYNNPDIDWQIKDAVEISNNMPKERNILQYASSVLQGYAKVLTRAEHLAEKKLYDASKNALESYDYEGNKDYIDICKYQKDSFAKLLSDVSAMSSRVQSAIEPLQKKSKSSSELDR